jgi:hypothetical protein
MARSCPSHIQQDEEVKERVERRKHRRKKGKRRRGTGRRRLIWEYAYTN